MLTTVVDKIKSVPEVYSVKLQQRSAAQLSFYAVSSPCRTEVPPASHCLSEVDVLLKVRSECQIDYKIGIVK